MKTLTDQYRLIEEGKGNKDGFLRNAKRQFPNYVPNHATYNQATNLLKKKGIISENFVGTPMVGNPLERKKEGFENAFEKFLKEAEVKAEEKKVSKEVEEDLSKNYDAYDKKNPDNMIFGQIQMGVYYEAKQEKNVDKTLEEIKSIVFKNLEKDPIYYTKNHMYGTDMGYTEDAPGLGIPKEPKGKHKSSGYGNLKEHSISTTGGIVTKPTFSSQNYMDFFGLNEVEHIPSPEDEERIDRITDKMEKLKNLEEDEIQENIDPSTFGRLDGIMPLKELKSFLDAMQSAYDELQLAEESIRDIQDDKDVKDVLIDDNDITDLDGPLFDYLVIQARNAIGRDADVRLIKSLVKMAMQI